ncbi:putative spastin-like protein spas-1 [Bienertia sinuspersici]
MSYSSGSLGSSGVSPCEHWDHGQSVYCLAVSQSGLDEHDINIIGAISSQPSLDDNEEFEEDVLEEENDQENRVTMEDDTDTEAYYDQEGPIGQGVGLEDAYPHDLDIEPVNEREVMNIEEEGELNNSGTTRKRGTVYCRKLTMLPPVEKLNVEFDEDGNAIGAHASLFSFFWVNKFKINLRSFHLMIPNIGGRVS